VDLDYIALIRNMHGQNVLEHFRKIAAETGLAITLPLTLHDRYSDLC
jgi:hypothetical protein